MKNFDLDLLHSPYKEAVNRCVRVLNSESEQDDSERLIAQMSPLIDSVKITVKEKLTLHKTKYAEMHQKSRNKRLLKRVIMLSVAVLSIMLFEFVFGCYFANFSRTATLPDWSRDTSRDIHFYVLPNENTTLIESTDVCKQTGRIFLLIVVCSSAKNFDARQTIRETWANISEFNYSMFHAMHSHLKGKYLPHNYFDRNDTSADNNASNTNRESSQLYSSVKILFLVGQSDNEDVQVQINNESELFNDVIQERFLDSYNNLTLKTVMMLKWVNSNCVDKVQFLMKSDDDTFVNIPNLMHVLLGGTIAVYKATLQEFDASTVRVMSNENRLNRQTDVLMGRRFCKAKPISNVQSKWYAPYYMYEKQFYPNYLSGTGYVMSMDVVKRLYNESLMTPLFHLEDVYLTGICAENLDIKRQNHHLFNYMSYRNLCEFKGMITIHNISPGDMKKAYDFVIDTKNRCPGVNKSVKDYLIRVNRDQCNKQ